MHDRVIGPFFFTEKTVSSVVSLDIMENFVFPQLEELQSHVFLQQHGAPPHWGTIVCSSLNDHFTGRWIGRGGLIPWPPRSPDIMPLAFCLWGFVKDTVYRRRVSNFYDLKVRITTAIASVDADMLAVIALIEEKLPVIERLHHGETIKKAEKHLTQWANCSIDGEKKESAYTSVVSSVI
ncbi:hypothetical protein X975_19712, partial [Stegodyphus mimosarum]